MRIALTGGSGGIGRAVIAMALQRGDTIVSIDRVAPAAQQDRVHQTENCGGRAHPQG